MVGGNEVRLRFGIEEEYYVLNPETRFFSSDAGLVKLKAGLRKIDLLKKSVVEIPTSLRDLGECRFFGLKSFSLLELREGPLEDVLELVEDLREDRRVIAEAAESAGCVIAPTGLHPAHREEFGGALSCGLHVHVSSQDPSLGDRIQKIRDYVPALVALSCNSPYAGYGRGAESSRLFYGNIALPPKDLSEKHADLFFNPVHMTCEFRFFDTQTTTDRVEALLLILRFMLSEAIDIPGDGISYRMEREKAILSGKRYFDEIREQDGFLGRILGLMEDAGYGKSVSLLVEGESQSQWQVDVAKEVGFGGLVDSLWETFRRDELTASHGKEQGIDERLSVNPWWLPISAAVTGADISYKLLRDRLVPLLR